jgi:hypothetical protein
MMVMLLYIQDIATKTKTESSNKGEDEYFQMRRII